MPYAILLGLVVFVALLIMEYNVLIAKKNQNDYAFSQIDVFLKKRHDLIPNLVACVKSYMEHERETLTAVTELRAKAVSGGLSPEEQARVEGRLSGALGRLMVAVENYPELKADRNFLQLQAAINEMEEQLAAARRAFNACVTDYNNAVQMFPTRFMAGLMGLERRALYAAGEEDRQAPDIAAQLQ